MKKPPFILDLIASFLSILSLGLFVKWAFFTHKMHDVQFYSSAALVCTVIGFLVCTKLKDKGSTTRWLQIGLMIQALLLGLIVAIACFYAIMHHRG